MNKIGLKSFSLEHLFKEFSFKRDLLLFDKVVIDSDNLNMSKKICEALLSGGLSPINETPKNNLNHNLNEIDYLSRKGFLKIIDLSKQIVISTNQNEKEKALFIKNATSEIQTSLDTIQSLKKTYSPDTVQRIANSLKKISDYSLRLYNVQQIDKDITNLYPILIHPEEIYSNDPISKNIAIQIILKQIPFPNSSVSWEDIEDFKNNQDIMAKYYMLINWMNEISKKEIKVDEFEDTFNYLYNDYLNRLKVSRNKYDLGTVEIIVNASAVVLENLPKLKFSEISKSFFRFINRKTTLMESELQIKNREIAYLYDVQKNFH